METHPWVAPPPDLAPPSSGVDVWRIRLDLAPAARDRLRATLAPDEQARADRFRSPIDGGRFIAGRGSLRAILGLYLGASPETLRLDAGPHGKPRLTGPHRASGLEFNLSHTGGLAALAVADGRRVGADIEAVRPIVAMERIVERFFSPRERSAIAALPESSRLAAFFRTWTSKESYQKATGLGMTVPLDGFDVAVDPGAPPALLDVRGRPGEAARWTIRDLPPCPGHLGAIAAEGDWSEIHAYDLLHLGESPR